MSNKAKELVGKYEKLTDEEKCEFLESLDEMGGIETYTIGQQIDDFIESVRME